MSILTTFTNIILHILQKTDAKNLAFYDQEENQEIFTNVKFFDASITKDKQLMEHPKEDGTLITDHVVDNPTEINVQVLIDDFDSSSLNQINDYYKNSTPIVIKVKNQIYPNMVMSGEPFKADSNHYNETVYDLSFKEVQEAVTQYVKMSVPQVKQKQNASTQKLGHKQAQKVSKTTETKVKRSVLRDLQLKAGIK